MKETLVLRDENNQALTCEILKQVVLDDMTYALITPTEVTVELLAWEEETEEDRLEDPSIDGALEELEPEELELILPTARAVLAELNLNLHNSAFELMTVAGEIPSLEEDDVIEIAKDEAEVEEYQLLATFYHEEKQYGVFMPLDPLLLFAALPEDAEPYLLTPDYPDILFEQLQDKLLDLAE